MRVFVLLGKGGVGKTTLSLALGCAFRARGEKVRVISLDPAHNLQDLQAQTRCTPWPELEEVDLDRERERRQRAYTERLRRRFPLQELFAGISPERLMEVYPGLEEETFLDVLQHILSESDDTVRVLDFPPTGYALRVLRWATWHRWWTQALLRLRTRILERKQTLARLAEAEDGEDPWMTVLRERAARMEHLEKALRQVHYLVVETPDPLARMEARRIHQALNVLGYMYRSLLNRSPEGIPETREDPVGAARSWFLQHLPELERPKSGPSR
ncbi:MAG: AAA family ATPase [Candidatus Hydrothermae bacterium]|nr:AAA family ATPase [Candidatus Hydrothermae bacterium]